MSVLSQFVGGTRSVQYGSISLAGAVTTATATITAVTTSKAVLIPLGQSGTGTDVASFFNSITLTNATTVTATRGASINGLTVNFVVVEFF